MNKESEKLEDVPKELETKDLVGLTIFKALINEEKQVVCLKTDVGETFLSWDGDCCAHCYLAGVSGADNLIGAKILEASDKEYKNIENDEENCIVVHAFGTKLKTTKGYVDLEARVEHNGYYGGFVKITTIAPIDQYSDKRDFDLKKMKPLKDF